MHELLNDPIDVIVSFKDNRILPCSLRWNEQNYVIKKNIIKKIIKKFFE